MGDRLFALAFQEARFYIFHWGCGAWEKGPEYKLSQYSDGSDENGQLCATGSHLYISKYMTDIVLVYTLTGEFEYKTGKQGSQVGELCNPFIQEADKFGKVLVCDNKCFIHRQVIGV